jgi:PAS domain S-box-containing protein
MISTLDTSDDSDRYRLLVDAISDYAIYMLDAEGHVASWNPGAERFKGYTRDEIVGQHVSRLYTPEDNAAGLPELALRTAAREGRFEKEGWRLRKDGTRCWADVIIDPIIAPDGEVIGYAMVTRDFTERRRAEDELRLSEQRFRYLVQGVTDYAIYMLDPRGIVTNWNSGAERIKGYTPEEIVGQHFSTFYTEQDRARHLPEQNLEIARTVGRFEKEGIRVRKDGTRFWANVVIDAIHDERGELIGFAKVTRDITERRAAEQALAHANEELMQSQKLEAIGRLTGGVAHDFNNLLMAVSGSLELLRKRLDDEKLVKLVDNAMQGIQRGTTLTQRMLAFARRQDLRPDSVDLGRLVGGLIEMVERTLGPSVEIVTALPDDLPPILIDENQLELAIINLAVNANDAMPNGGRLTIAADEASGEQNAALQPGRYVRLSITDTGEGMDAATLSHAMEPFFTTKGVGKGTGLGLAMVRGLSEQSGGTVTIQSEAGHGTVVTMWIPVSYTAVAAEVAPVEAVPETGGPRRLRVLVVDDDVLVAMNTTAMLEDLGHEAVEVHSGRQALETLAEANGFDLVITDQAMPQMTGSQFVSEARAKWPDLQVILATGYAELPDDADRTLPRLNKPFMQSDLERVLRQVTGTGAQ